MYKDKTFVSLSFIDSSENKLSSSDFKKPYSDNFCLFSCNVSSLSFYSSVVQVTCVC